MPRSNREGTDLIYEVAKRFKQAALLSTDSLLTPGESIWTAAALDELNRCFVLQPDQSSLSFEQKLTRQLAGASDQAVQLMAEILLIHLLINSRISGKRKRELLRAVLDRGTGTSEIDLPPEIDEALDYGICWPGTFFNTGRDRQVRFLIDWMREWRKLSFEECARLLDGPWAFKEQLFQVDAQSASLQRNALLHLLFPDHFERIMAPDHKAAVVAAFAERIDGKALEDGMDEDQALLEIRHELAKEYGEEFDFYDTAEVKALWQGSPVSPHPTTQIPLLDRVLAYYPDWSGFSDPRYLEEERDYKVRASELAISLLGKGPLQELIDQGRTAELVGRIEQVTHATNLLWTNVPRAGDLAVLYHQGLYLPSFAEALFDLLHGEGDSPERLDRFIAYTNEHNLPTKWTLPTYLLMLLSPETDFFVKPDMTRWFLKEVSSDVELATKPSGDGYRRLLGVVTALRDVLSAYEPSDLVDIQGYIWVANHSPLQPKLGKPFDEMFPDWDTAWWAFDVLHEGLNNLGVDGAGDNKVAVTLTHGSVHVSFASWLVFGFGREKGMPHAAVVPLRVDSSLLPEAYVSTPFVANSSVRLRYLPVAHLRDSWEDVQEELKGVLETVDGVFSNHVATPYRIHNRAEIEAAIFDETTREKLLREGLVLAPAPEDSLYGHLASTGYRFPQWLVTDYVLSLGTKPFVILSGISGTGKTKLAQLVSAFVAPDREMEVVVPSSEIVADGFTQVEVRQSAITYRRLNIPASLVEGLRLPAPYAPTDLTVEAGGQAFPARLYVYPSARNLQVHMKPELYDWFVERVKVGDYIGMKVAPIAEGVPDFELEITTLPVERRTEKQPSPRVAFLSVRPDWTDNRGLLGYYNPLMCEYVVTPLLRLLLRAHAHPHEPHFVILDEMNLAKVEYYFSDFLSAMESGTPMELHGVEEGVYMESDGTAMLVPSSLTVPENVFFTGTVNVDETTYMFSPKVLDRANTIEFNEVQLDRYGSDFTLDSGEFRLRGGVEVEDILQQLSDRGKPSPVDWAALPAEYKERLRSLHAVMERHHLHFGYRVANEVARYLLLVAQYVGEDALELAFDLQILQKVLPKMAGNRARLYQPLRELLQWCIDPATSTGGAISSGQVGASSASAALPSSVVAISVESARYPRSATKLKRMLETLETVGFVSFVE